MSECLVLNEKLDILCHNNIPDGGLMNENKCVILNNLSSIHLKLFSLFLTTRIRPSELCHGRLHTQMPPSPPSFSDLSGKLARVKEALLTFHPIPHVAYALHTPDNSTATSSPSSFLLNYTKSTMPCLRPRFIFDYEMSWMVFLGLGQIYGGRFVACYIPD
ncbi:hypothetical protein PV326_008906 [Microctonus aethiopoides]|nr:hypothetical protein PV326_008906 [Microctonus aethiopoides]